MDNRWLSVEEIADHLGVSKDTIYTWVCGGRMPGHKVGRLWKFKRMRSTAGSVRRLGRRSRPGRAGGRLTMAAPQEDSVRAKRSPIPRSELDQTWRPTPCRLGWRVGRGAPAPLVAVGP